MSDIQTPAPTAPAVASTQTAQLPQLGHIRNPGMALDMDWVLGAQANRSAIERRCATLPGRRSVKKAHQAAWLLKALSCIDLTTLAGDDTDGRVARLCAKARSPLRADLAQALGAEGLTVGAVCVYHDMIAPAKAALAGTSLPVAAVSTGFPAGLSPLHLRIREIEESVAAGADEIDIVIDFDALMDGERDKVATDLAQMRQACGDKVLKVILETPELDLSYIELGAKLALEFGADFIKTCTGRRGGCTPLVARCLAELLATWSHENNGKARGLKLSGGIREPGQAEGYLDIVRTALGDGFVHPATFRFGTSRILS